MLNAIINVPEPRNEPIKSYAPGNPEREELKKQVEIQRGGQFEIPLFIGGEEVTSGDLGDCRMPHRHGHVLARFHKASKAHVERAIEAARKAAPAWAALDWEHRAAIFLKAADLLAGPYRQILNAATVNGQSKNPFQAEIDSACELIDFYRFNPHYARQIFTQQPNSAPGIWDYVEHRPLEGFVFAVTPFNFTSIAGNLPTAPALMGNVVLWKPASSAVYSAYYIMKILMEAGLPPGVINFVPGSGGQVGDPAVDSPHFAGVHFTGSTSTFQAMWRRIGSNIASYRAYPRIVGETGGKDFVFAHCSADVDALVVALLRGSFEYQGQKCSAASRAYIPESIWPAVKERLLDQMKQMKMGDPAIFSNFINAVIDKAAFDSIKSYIDHAKSAPDATILAGGRCDDSVGYFIEPTVVQTTNPRFKLICEEIFGPVLTIFVYPDNKLDETLQQCDTVSPYALTGAVFAQDRYAIAQMARTLTNTAGNFYINDKPTGAVVGQQPFGGGRASGTNDKAGSMINLLRWVTPRAVKETFVPPKDWRYPFLG
ncbi:MAG: L-glutamate gamma-semialdehyde dehydrogenase [candidate division Zixibacteria bacterium]|nr:L-glutamate gamma-semialdehyde dehydrogenase [candidate division Zixibacteria bacterium]